jgi:putative DNA primase/helicase
MDALFSQKRPTDYILIYTLPNKRSEWFLDTIDAAEYVEKTARETKQNVYVGVGLSPEDYGEHKRCQAENITSIPALWADFDIAGEGHKKQNLPPDEAAVRTLLDECGLKPPILVHSGHGLQAWWLFDEPWIFTDPEDRQDAMQLATDWTRTMKALAARKGWDVDATQDLARILRVPGSFNNKGEPVPVRLLELNSVRYNIPTFRMHLVRASDTPQKAKVPDSTGETVKKTSGALVLSANASPPFDKFELLKEIEAKVGQSWERKRKDLQDQSASSYDMALANYAAMAAWTDQEIVDLLIASRRKHGDDLKLREDYYQRTIAKAREGIRKQKVHEEIDELAAANEAAPDEPEGEGSTERREQVISALSEVLEVQISRIVKYLSDPPIYRLETPAGSILLGEVGNLINQVAFRAKVAAATGKYIPKAKGERWDTIAQLLLDVCEDVELGAESTDEGSIREWVLDYLNERKPVENSSEAAALKVPFVKDGFVYLFGANFRQWLNLNQGEKIGNKTIGILLRGFGAIPDVVWIQVDGSDSTRSVWRLPKWIDPKTFNL